MLVFFRNQTDKICSISTVSDRNECKRFVSQSYNQITAKKSCAGCVKVFPDVQMLGREIEYNMNDRTHADLSTINCQAKNCNEVQIGILIQEKFMIHFDLL
ncbi:hypothetical protein I4U23_012466 [Adineta vaga]|nr:hypothetical protein I4U23_012466 [Adineta vaga]